MKVLKRHKGLAIIGGLTLILLVVIFAIFSRMIFSTGKGEYGDRLNGLKAISKSVTDEVISETKELDEVIDVKVRTQGRIVYTTITFTKDTSKDKAKEIAAKTLEHYDEVAEYSKEELVNQEFNTFGFYLKSHPVSKYKDANAINTLLLDDYNEKYINIVLEVINIKEIMTKKNDVMAFIKASDEYKQIDLTLFPNEYQTYHNLKKHDIINVYGKVEKRFDNYQLVVSKITMLKE